MFRLINLNGTGAALLGSTALCMSISSAAHGDAPRTISFSKLPESELTLHLSAAPPARLGPTERAAGFHLATPRPQVMFLSGTKLKNPDSIDAEELPRDVCFSNGRVESNVELTTEFPISDDLEVLTTLPTFFGNGQAAPIVAARMQKLTRTGVDASLEVRDAWIDPMSRGSRLIRKRILAFQKVATFVGGIDVFASRDRGSVHFIVARPEPSAPSAVSEAPATVPLLSRGMRPIVSEGEDGSSSSQFCDHLRITLPAERGEGSKTTLRVPVVLSREKLKQPPPESDGEPAPNAMIEERFRELGIHLSTSWFSKDLEPVISVTAGWLSRERKERSEDATTSAPFNIANSPRVER